MNESDNQSRNKLLWMGVGGVTVVALCICMALAGFAIGRSTASPEVVTETVTETTQVEVTREIPVIVEVEATADSSVATATAVPQASPPDTISPIQSELDFSLFDEAWDVIERNYDGEAPPVEELQYAAIEGSIEALDDQFTRLIRPDVAARLREDMGGSVSGIGAIVTENDGGFFEIVTPIEGQPADLAGLLPGDIVIEVDGESVIDVSFDEVILLVRGPSGTTVNLAIAREGEAEPLEFTIVRATFEVPVVESEMLPDDIAYVRLVEFNRAAESSLLAALDELLAQNPQAIIFDLRNNPGGFLDQSIAVADIFLPQGVVLYERNRNGLDETFRSDNGDAAETIPLVVLVNEFSASASEIVAGAIQDTGRGTLIGATTFGKGSVQTVQTLSDGSELRVTIARWYTPNNNSIDKEGVSPDIEAASSVEIGGDEDEQLQRAVEFILTGQ